MKPSSLLSLFDAWVQASRRLCRALFVCLIAWMAASPQGGWQAQGGNSELLETIARAAVRLEFNLPSGLPVNRSGFFVTQDGMIFTVASDFLEWDFEVGQRVNVETFNDIRNPPVPSFVAEVILADYDLNMAILQVIEDTNGNTLDALDIDVDFINIDNAVGAQAGDVVSIVGYLEIGGGVPNVTTRTITATVFERRLGFATYRTDSELDQAGTGGVAVTNGGDPIGIATEIISDSGGSVAQFVTVLPMVGICNYDEGQLCEMAESQAPEPPEDRSVAPPGSELTDDGVGGTTGEEMNDGNFQVEYYCPRWGYDIRITDMASSPTGWECWNDSGTRALLISDMDRICQETYDKPNAFAIQDGTGDHRAYRWRCYDFPGYSD